MDRDDLDAMADVWKAVGNATRLATLRGMREERTLQAIADDIGVSRNAVQMQSRELEERDLIYRDVDADYRYQLTPVGETLLELNDEFGPVFVEALKRVEEAEEEAREENQHLSGDTFERAVEQRKWALVSEELKELLKRNLE